MDSVNYLESIENTALSCKGNSGKFENKEIAIVISKTNKRRNK